MFRPSEGHMSLISIGDRVRFRQITPGEFAKLSDTCA
jgi:allophanate hydrolase subunit 1